MAQSADLAASFTGAVQTGPQSSNGGITMNAAAFIDTYAGHRDMTRAASCVVVETTQGYMMARATGATGTVAYAASYNTAQAIGDATAAAMYGDFTGNTMARETAEDALSLAQMLNACGC